MRDFRSLEQKYRQMVEDRMNRNTDLRRKVENVGRPKDDVRDAETSKLAKQAEIKTKIIDEEHVEESYSFKKTEGKKWEGVGFGSTPAYHELHADGKPTGITVGGTKAGSYFVKKDGKHVTSSSSMDFAKKAAVDHHKGISEGQVPDDYGRKLTQSDSLKLNAVSDMLRKEREKKAAQQKAKTQKEEVELDEAASDAAVPKDDIQTNSNSPDPAVTKDKKKKESSASDVDAKKITGGKTEVDLKPSTDDTPEDTSKEDEKSKKATNQENKKIGAKGVKEETMTSKHFGLPESLIQSVNEVLKGNQHKIDANHNGKIDAQDFKILKGKKKVTEEDKSCGCKGNCKCSTNEEVENVSETYSDDIAIHKDKESFRKHADQVNRKHHEDGAEDTNSRHGESYTANGKTFARWHEKHGIGFVHSKGQHLGHHGGPKLMHEEVEQIDEISSKLARKAEGKSITKMNKAIDKGDYETELKRRAQNNYFSSYAAKKEKAAKAAKMKEEVEQIDELKKSTLASYVNKSAQSQGHASWKAGQADTKNYKEFDKHMSTINKRAKGIKTATDKLQKEEVQLSDAELARIEEITKGFNQ